MDKLSFDFKTIIAFLAPGLVALYALGLVFDPLGRSVGMGNSSITAAQAVIIALLAIACGMIVNAVSFVVLRPIVNLFGPPRPNIKYANITQENIVALTWIVETLYFYHLTYANMFVSFFLFAVTAYHVGIFGLAELSASFVLLVILFIAARKTLLLSQEQTGELLPEKKTQ